MKKLITLLMLLCPLLGSAQQWVIDLKGEMPYSTFGSCVVDNDGDMVAVGFCEENGDYQSTVSRYHGELDFTPDAKSFVMNRYDASYCNGGSTYSVINPPVLRYNFGFLFSIRY